MISGASWCSALTVIPHVLQGLLGHLNNENCGFPYATPIDDCEYGGATWATQPASGYKDTPNVVYNMPKAKTTFPDCVYMTRVGVQTSTQDIAGWNSIDKLCILGTFKYYVYRWPATGVKPKA